MGATDPSSGTASMLELSRVLANLKKETGESAGRGWRAWLVLHESAEKPSVGIENQDGQ